MIRKASVRRITALYPFSATQKNKGTTENKMRVAAYCRVSSESDEQRVSYITQIKYYESYIRSRPDYELAGIFADEGVSGTDCRKREAFNRLMEAAKSGQIDLIITKSLSRFGRNTLDCLKNIRELKMLRVDVFFEKENIHTLHSNGELLISLVSAIAQNESMNQSENVKWGIHRQYERGHIKSIPSGKFLGYKKDAQGNLIIDDAQAAVVRRIYQAFLNGLGTDQIATVLTKEGVPMAFGGKAWCADHIHKVLINEKYKGDTRFQKTYNVDFLTKRRAKNNGELPQYYLKDSHPAIIDHGIWPLVQLEFVRQKQFVHSHFMDKYHHSSTEYPLSGKIFCQECRHTLVMRESKRKANLGQKYWICRKFRSGRYSPVQADTCCNRHRVASIVFERLLVDTWNDLVERSCPLTDHGHDKLTTYWIEELKDLTAEYGYLDVIPQPLLIRILDHVEVSLAGAITVFFLAGVHYSIPDAIQSYDGD